MHKHGTECELTQDQRTHLQFLEAGIEYCNAQMRANPKMRECYQVASEQCALHILETVEDILK